MRKLGELSKEELHELLEKNNDFKAEVYEWAYQAQMDLQREELENMEADELDEKQDDYEERMSNVCDKLAEAITYQLRAYEDVSDEQIDFELEQIADGITGASDWETDGTIVYQHITKEYK